MFHCSLPFLSPVRCVTGSVTVVVKIIPRSLWTNCFITSTVSAIIVNPIGGVIVHWTVTPVLWRIVIVHRAIVVIKIRVFVVHLTTIPIWDLSANRSWQKNYTKQNACHNRPYPHPKSFLPIVHFSCAFLI